MPLRIYHKDKSQFYLLNPAAGIALAHQTRMKTQAHILSLFSILIGSSFIINGCSSMPGQSTSGKEVASTVGPSILNPRVEPSTIELDSKLQPVTTAEVLADVKDFQ